MKLRSLRMSLLVAGISVSGLVIAAEPLRVPAVLTPAGAAFAKQCTDEAFGRSHDPQALAMRCEALLATWEEEAKMRQEPRSTARRGPDYVYLKGTEKTEGVPEFLSLRSVRWEAPTVAPRPSRPGR